MVPQDLLWYPFYSLLEDEERLVDPGRRVGLRGVLALPAVVLVRSCRVWCGCRSVVEREREQRGDD